MRSNNIAKNLDFTIHLNIKSQTKLYVDICVYIPFTECVIVNKISSWSWMSYTINKITYYCIILLYNVSVNIFGGGGNTAASAGAGNVGIVGSDRNFNQRLILSSNKLA